MKVIYKEGNAPGHGSLVFSDGMFPDAPWSVSIQRGSDKKFLTGKAQNPWVSEAFFMELSGQGLPDGSLELNVGPRIVDRLDQQDVYRVKLKGEGNALQSAQLRIAAINYTPGGSLDNTADVRIKDETADQPEPAPPAPEKTQAEPAPQEQASGPDRLELNGEVPKPAPMIRYLRWAMMAVLVVACFAWYWLDPRNKEDAPPPPPSAQIEAPAQSVEDQVNAFFKGGKISPAQALELAQKLNKDTPSQQDAVYRLYYFAAENGEPEAALNYGACLDPSLPAWGSIEKNGLHAWNVYKKSPDLEKAAQAMTHLRGWLEDQAQAGNKKANQWLREIEK